METTSIIKNLLCDKDSIVQYCSGNLVTLSDIKRRLFLLERESNFRIPDHYYRLSRDKSFEKIDSIGDTIRVGLYRISDKYLEVKGDRVAYVKQAEQNEWQQLITKLPPLILLGALLHVKSPIHDFSKESISSYYHDFIKPNAQHTALPHPYIKQIQHLVNAKGGFRDLHIHLNGSTETDVAWQDFLRNPDKVYAELMKGFENSHVREQFEVESSLENPREYYNLLKIARRLRAVFWNFIFKEKCDMSQSMAIKTFFVNHILSESDLVSVPHEHPFSEVLPAGATPMSIELIMYVLILTKLARSNNEHLASLFHFYLLILGLTNRLLVQQTNQYGFEEFQKYTLNELRRHSELEYKNRFLQLCGNKLNNVRLIEGRFTPKDSELGNIALIKQIYDGWESVTRLISEPNLPELKLIAHFIKRPDDNKNSMVRFNKLRRNIWKQGIVLSRMREKAVPGIQNVVGIDAASSEFSTPPEVFAPCFRMLRRSGFGNFTFHAGEDFFDIISGLRVVYETVEFLELGPGDRIGHATACGISPDVWIKNVGKSILIRRGEHLDNLIFIYHLITDNDITDLHKLLPFIANDVSKYYSEVYHSYLPVETVLAAWRLRRYCPILTFSGDIDTARSKSVFDLHEWEDIQNATQKLQNDTCIKEYQKYHNEIYRTAYNEIIEIKTTGLLTNSDIIIIQLEILKLFYNRNCFAMAHSILVSQ